MNNLSSECAVCFALNNWRKLIKEKIDFDAILKVSSSSLPQYWQENLSLKKTLNLVKLGFDCGTI